MLIEMV